MRILWSIIESGVTLQRGNHRVDLADAYSSALRPASDMELVLLTLAQTRGIKQRLPGVPELEAQFDEMPESGSGCAL